MIKDQTKPSNVLMDYRYLVLGAMHYWSHSTVQADLTSVVVSLTFLKSIMKQMPYTKESVCILTFYSSSS